MEDVFPIIENLFNQQFSRAYFMGVVVGALIGLCGVIVIAIVMIFRAKGIAVQAKVIALHEEQRKSKKREGEALDDEPRRPLIRPEFEVLGGVHSGQKVKASSASSHADHIIGEIVAAYYVQSAQEMMSAKQIRSGLRFGAAFIGIGLFIAVLFYGLNLTH